MEAWVCGLEAVKTERPIVPPESGTEAQEGTNPLNTLFVVGFALLISLLALRLAGRGRRGR